MTIELRERYEPHWVWMLGSLVAPMVLLVVSLLGMGRGSLVSAGVAMMVPNVALATAAAMTGAAIIRGRRVPIVITLVGLAMTAAGFFWLRWIA